MSYSPGNFFPRKYLDQSVWLSSTTRRIRCFPDMILLLICPTVPATLLVASRTDEVNVCARVRKEVTLVGDVGAETFDDLLGVTNGFVPASESLVPWPGVVDAGLEIDGRFCLGVPSSFSSSLSPSRSPDENRLLRYEDVWLNLWLKFVNAILRPSSYNSLLSNNCKFHDRSSGDEREFLN